MVGVSARATGGSALGTRAAAFWPVRGLAATIVLDEHEPAHKALDAPRWHARELAIQRTRLEGGACLLVSGTPSLESWARVRAGAAVAEEAKDRSAWPEVHRVDLRTRRAVGRAADTAAARGRPRGARRRAGGRPDPQPSRLRPRPRLRRVRSGATVPALPGRRHVSPARPPRGLPAVRRDARRRRASVAAAGDAGSSRSAGAPSGWRWKPAPRSPARASPATTPR